MLLIHLGQLLLSALLGALIGIERESVNKAAGMRTCAMVTLGSSLFTIISEYGITGANVDPSRVASQIITGIGFIGAGLIIFHEKKLTGLTTASALWVAAAIGMAVGSGLYWVACFVTALALIILHFLPQLDGVPESARKKK